ncbi:eukaryotic peptide chain release factor GTP-binding subunit ERF3A isoform X3 [Selaginella moellendorffii]|uniref:eukaryotic peptide chain release factor GTP-binding subunit ERF3A isoform X3 n=1 Tax=Selaginella moellendorffii TaxID=88036 RepID=UPI000D1D0D2E|nr:eukaryotic peptide chain release factor GTP-binding subunit ERF3A isoform X3 [Selaginella moellendorffii]|eukprot:XP_024515754.1 eukaryotic peptide chain release factor GTP-binding subunit ERF3A isoform X3 [Selaginella moellendorffii]
MTDLDSWEEIESPAGSQAPAAPAASRLNPSAPSFTFNPSAPSFMPRAPAPPTPAPAPQPAHQPGFAIPVRIPVPEPEDSAPFDQANGMEVDPPKETKKEDPLPEEIVEKFEATKISPDVETRDEMDAEPAPSKEDFPEDVTDTRSHLNVVFIGHVDAGKSTIGGQILFVSGMVDERTIQKYEREAKEKNRESWYMAYIMDTNEEERAKGKTVEVGRASFETAKTRFTILDAPGHKNYVPNMISGASQADIGVLVISARKGEFETGFERGGQTREHAQLAKTLGVAKLLVVVNKMDDSSVGWEKERFDEIEKKMTPFLKSCGYNIKKDVQFLPISGLYGTNLKERMPTSVCSWWEGPCLFEALDSVEPPQRDATGPFRYWSVLINGGLDSVTFAVPRMPIIDRYKDMGTVVMGKIEAGSVRRGDNLVVMPNKAPVKVITIFRDADEVNQAKPGENLRIRLSGLEEDDISSGFVLSSSSSPIPAVLEFDAQLQVLELLDHKAIFTAGYKAVLHIHAVVEECEIMELMQQIDPKTKKPMKKKVLFVKSGAVVVVRIQVPAPICIEKFQDFPQMGRFTLRDEGKTVAIGKVIKLRQE